MLSADVAKRVISFFVPYRLSAAYAYRPLCTSRTYPTGQSRHTYLPSPSKVNDEEALYSTVPRNTEYHE